MPSTDFVYVVLNDGDFCGVGLTVRHALETAMGRTNQVEAWIQDHANTRTDFSVNVYDMTTTPPTLMDRPDLKHRGGPVHNDA